MKIRELGVVKVEYVFIREGFRKQDAYDLRLGTAQFSKESTAMILFNIFQDIIASYKGKYQNVESIRRTIPVHYIDCFERGLKS